MGEIRVERIYLDHYEDVRRSLRHLGVPESGLPDALQDVFVVVWRRLAEFEGRSSMRTWLFGITVRVASEHRRRSWRQRVMRTPSLRPTPPQPDEALARAEAARLLQLFLDHLSPSQRAVFVMADVEGHSVPEIAKTLGMGLNTTYSRLRLARRRFARLLARHRKAQERL